MSILPFSQILAISIERIVRLETNYMNQTSMYPSVKSFIWLFWGKNTIESSGASRISRGGGANPWDWDENLLFSKMFAENCMVWKKLDREAGRVSLAPLWIRQWNHSEAVWNVLRKHWLRDVNDDRFKF